MATLYSRGGVWYVFSQVNGRRYRKSTGTTSRQEAERLLREIRADLLKQKLNLPPSPIGLKTAINQFLNGCAARLKPRTVRRYHEIFRHLLAFAPNVSHLSDITTEVLENYSNHRRELGRAPRTVQDELETISTLFKWAIRMKRAVENPVAAVSKAKIVSKAPRAFSVEELKAIFSRAGKYRDFYEVLYRTAFRLSEALEIRVRDIDLKRSMILYHNLKAGRDEWCAINERLAPILARRIKGRDRDDLVFPEEFKTHKHNWNKLRMDFKNVLKAAGIAEGTLHDFKRTHVTHLLNAGVHPTVVQVSAHHTNVSTTMGYSQGPGDLLAGAINKLPV